MPKEKTIEKLLEAATEHYFHISQIHKTLLKYGYSKCFTEYLKDVQARVTYRKILKEN